MIIHPNIVFVPNREAKNTILEEKEELRNENLLL